MIVPNFPRFSNTSCLCWFLRSVSYCCDLLAQGVIDPVKVTRSAVLNAASIAAMLLTTEALVAEKAGGRGRGCGRGWPRSLARSRPLNQHLRNENRRPLPRFRPGWGPPRAPPCGVLAAGRQARAPSTGARERARWKAIRPAAPGSAGRAGCGPGRFVI